MAMETKTMKVVLIGGGHCHIQLVKGLHEKARPEGLELIVIDQQRYASYSGMVPGCVAGVYREKESKIDIKKVAAWAKCRFYQKEVTDVDLEKKQVFLKNGKSISYDLISFDIGSSTRNSSTLPGSQFIVPTRPISSLTPHITSIENKIRQFLPPLYQTSLPTCPPPEYLVKVVVVGGGMSGIELSFSIQGRWGDNFPHMEVHLLDCFDKLLAGEEEVVREAFLEQMEERNIHHHQNVRVKEVTKDEVIAEDGRRFACSPGAVLWATGAEPHGLHSVLEKRGLALNEKGWINVSSTLQSTSHPMVFAAGDCANVEQKDGPSPPKAGVYAVRAGPTLQKNIMALWEGKELEEFSPQKDFLKLVGCGDRTALGIRWGLPFYGKWVWDLKNKIDVMFMDLFRPSLLPDLSSSLGDEGLAQYDSVVDLPEPPESEEVAVKKLGEKTGDYALCWAILRRMMRDEEYKERVCSLYRKNLVA